MNESKAIIWRLGVAEIKEDLSDLTQSYIFQKLKQKP